jgi:hypothetical protein
MALLELSMLEQRYLAVREAASKDHPERRAGWSLAPFAQRPFS